MSIMPIVAGDDATAFRPTPFAPRRMAAHTAIVAGALRRKRYTVQYGSGAVDWGEFASGMTLAVASVEGELDASSGD